MEIPAIIKQIWILHHYLVDVAFTSWWPHPATSWWQVLFFDVDDVHTCFTHWAFHYIL
jgi:hypothetical protein